MRHLLLLTFFSCFFHSGKKDETEPFMPVEKRFPMLWKVKTGLSSFRTNLLVTGSKIIIGSNGDNFRDANFFDSHSGVYVIDAASGKIISHFAGEKIGDMDVNGTLLYNGLCYFGNDNEEFICSDLKGNIRWRKAASGDVEHEPTLIRRKEGDLIVYASEAGEVRAVEPSTGKTIWSYYTPDFKGYKPHDNRMMFKIKCTFFSPTILLRKPLVEDLNSDGVSDLIYSSSSDIYALNGSNGRILWTNHTDNLYSCDLARSGTSEYPVFTMAEINIKYEKIGDKFYSRDHFITFDKKGRILEKVPFNSNNNWPGLNHYTTADCEVVFATEDSLYFLTGGIVSRTVYHGCNYEHPKRWSNDTTFSNRNSRDELFSVKGFTYAGNRNCSMILNQYDNGHSDAAFIEILSTQSGTVLDRFSLPERSEMPPVLTDLNGDGNLELLVSCYDGFLYCYKTDMKSL